MRFIHLFIALLIGYSSLSAQTLTGKVMNEKKEPLANATVGLLKLKDSILLRSTITDMNGFFTLPYTDTVLLLLSISSAGYQTQLLKVESINNFSITMVAASKQLKEVVVQGKKPMIEVKPDKIIFNIENSINAVGSTAFDLLRKSPGVIIDNNETISLLGAGVAIYTDGKPAPLTGTELAAFLKSLQSTDIEAIELIKNPPAKYDAAGAGGIINIKLKKNKNYGLNGSLNTGYGIGIFSKYNNGINLNYRNKKINVFGNYSTYWGKNQSFMNLYREQADSIFDQKTTSQNKYEGNNIKTGIDIFINKKNTIGVLVSVFGDNWDNTNKAVTPIANLNTKIPARTLIADNKSKGNKINSNFNLNYKYTDTSGKEWNTDMDFGIFNNVQNNLQPNRYTTPNLQTILEEKTYTIVTDRSIQLFTLKSDYKQNFKGGRLGFGIKTSFVKTANSFDFSNVINNQPIIDNNRSNDFTLTENINAA